MTSTVTTLFKMVFAGAVLTAFSGPVNAQMVIPDDMQDTCPVKSAIFNGWFSSGAPSPNGAVSPANSLTFPTDNTVCDFYKWGAQMFLWLTSPEGDGLVLDGPSIFTVMPADAGGKRYLVANTTGANFKMVLRSEKFDDIGEVGQAGGGGVLMSQGKSLVYYGVHVNDLYGYFLTGQKRGSFPGATTFPRNSADLNAIEIYVKKTFPRVELNDPQTLAMELKTSWVDASSVGDRSRFVTVEAEVPTYKADDGNTTWTPSGTTKMVLALTGIHVVGTVRNHPEFVWATFENVMNAPDGDYWYRDASGAGKEQSYSPSGDFLFMPSGGNRTNTNVECMKEKEGNIVANPVSKTNPAPKCKGGIAPSKTYRQYPWGSKEGDKSAAAVKNNTLLLSVNNSVISQLSDGDVRKNYVQTGGIWTSAPSPTADAPIPVQPGFQSSDVRGSLTLSNATMETYTQGTNCFSCHKQSADAKNSFGSFQLSHIYAQIVPLSE